MHLGLHLPDLTWPGGAPRLASQLTDIAQGAEDAGFEMLTVMDHLWQIGVVGPPEHEMLEAYTTLGYLAARTSRVSLLAMVTGVVYREPGLLAKIVTTLDVLSGGRGWLGVGAAWNEDEARGLSERLSAQGHRLFFAVETDSEISGAATELQSAMSNLVSNAVRYTPPGGEVTVTWRMLPDGRGEFAVRDTGPGIAAEHIPRLTERFYRVDRSRSRETGGTGLGLAIVKHIAQRHGAQLRIESTPGQGSRFALLFPVTRLRPARPLSVNA